MNAAHAPLQNSHAAHSSTIALPPSEKPAKARRCALGSLGLRVHAHSAIGSSASTPVYLSSSAAPTHTPAASALANVGCDSASNANTIGRFIQPSVCDVVQKPSW